MSEEVIELPPDDLPEEEIAERDTFDCEEQVGTQKTYIIYLTI